MGELLSRVEGATRLTYGEAFQAAALLCQGQQETVAALLDTKMARQRQRPWQQRSGGFAGSDWQVVVAFGSTCSPSLLLLLLLSCCFACQPQTYSHSVLFEEGVELGTARQQTCQGLSRVLSHQWCDHGVTGTSIT
jgi:hypothetical protein